MTKRMLINATQSEELRVALVDGRTLYDLDVERTGKTQTKASIFKGRVTRVEPSLEAAFIDFGSNRHGFLPIKEVARECFHENATFEHGRPNIKDVLRPGQELIVQVDKEERGTKGAALTTFISLAGCYLVLMPNNPRAGGISRRIEGEERDDLKDVLNQLPVPEGMGLIVRTAGLGRSIEELQWDLDVLLIQWKAISAYANANHAPLLIHKDSDVVVRAIRDYLRPDIGEIIVDTEKAFKQVEDHLNLVRPDFISRLKLYQEPTPLFSSFQIETQIESAYKREIALENGASIVIDHTEALIAVDINSAKATEGSDIEETALQTNLAAASEIARQLRLRDIGGLIVIDFIDMNIPRHQRMVENKIREELKSDRARIQMGRISRFGLLEMSRQRLRPALGETTHITCPRCEGQGNIRSIHSVSMAIIRVIEEEVMKEHTGQLNVQVPIEVASYLLNEKRESIAKLEQSYHVGILIIPNKHFETPHYEFQRLRKEDAANARKTPSYKQITTPQATQIESTIKSFENKVEPDSPLKHITPPAPSASRAQDSGLIKRIWKAVFGANASKALTRGETQNTDANQESDTRHHHHGAKRQQHGGRKDNRKRHGHNRRSQNNNRSDNNYRDNNRDNNPNRDTRDVRDNRDTRDNRDNPNRENSRDHNRDRSGNYSHARSHDDNQGNRHHHNKQHHAERQSERHHHHDAPSHDEASHSHTPARQAHQTATHHSPNEATGNAPQQQQRHQHHAHAQQGEQREAREPREHRDRDNRDHRDNRGHREHREREKPVSRTENYEAKEQNSSHSAHHATPVNASPATSAAVVNKPMVAAATPTVVAAPVVAPKPVVAVKAPEAPPALSPAQEKAREEKRNAVLNVTSFTPLSNEEKQSTFVAPLEKIERPLTENKQTFKQVVSKRSTYDEKPHDLPTIANQSRISEVKNEAKSETKSEDEKENS